MGWRIKNFRQLQKMLQSPRPQFAMGESPYAGLSKYPVLVVVAPGAGRLGWG